MVILIIGILAAVALPQYNKANVKAKAMEAIINLKAINDAQTRYYLLHGIRTDKLDDLDTTVQDSQLYRYACLDYNDCCYAHSQNSNYPTFEWCGSTLYCRGTEKKCKPFNAQQHPTLGTNYWVIKPGSF